MEKIDQLLDQAMQAISDDEMMQVASDLISLKEPTKVNQAMRERCQTVEGREQMEQLRSCFLKLLT